MIHALRNKYFVGYALTGRDKEMVDALRKRIAAQCGVRAALHIPPHMTIFRPFETDRVEPLLHALNDLASRHNSFTLPITGFAAFNEAVWFLDPTQDPALFALKSRIDDAVEASIGMKERRLHQGPYFHVTLAYKDVSPDAHRRIRKMIEREPLPIHTLVIDAIALFEQKPDSPRWETRAVFRFQGSQ